MISVNFVIVLRNKDAPLDSQEVLVQLRDDKNGILFPGQWAIPGGVSKGKEKIPEEIVRREVKEELDINISSKELIPFKEVVVTRFSGETIKGFVFLIIFDSMPLFSCSEGIRFEFKKLSEILKLDIPDSHRNIFNEILERWSKCPP